MPDARRLDDDIRTRLDALLTEDTGGSVTRFVWLRQFEVGGTRLTLREIGRVERTLFIIDWLLDADMQRRAQVGLNKDEAHHALKTPYASAVRVKSAIAPPRASTSGWPG